MPHCSHRTIVPLTSMILRLHSALQRQESFSTPLRGIQQQPMPGWRATATNSTVDQSDILCNLNRIQIESNNSTVNHIQPIWIEFRLRDGIHPNIVTAENAVAARKAAAAAAAATVQRPQGGIADQVLQPDICTGIDVRTPSS